MGAAAAIRLHDEVAAALREGRPVVALETAVLTHGLPREPAPHLTAVAAIEVPYRGTLAPFQNRIIAAVSVQSNLPLFFGDYRAGKSNDDDAGDSMASEGSFDIVRIDGRDDG